ncbi:MAG: glycosyltransferase family 2 protein, partial [Aquificaceae bacterium]
SIIIPTKDNKPILENCIKSIFSKTTYKNYELIIVDNQSSDYETIEYLKYLSSLERIKVLNYKASFNFSAINNFAAKHAKGEVLVFLNNDTEIITPQWLEIMLGCLEQPKVGAVGVKLLYPNDTIQHAGVIIGLHGTADHPFKGYGRYEEGYMGRACLQQDLSAVTGACMMTWKYLFEEFGGFDEVNLPVAFNDVDYCLKLRSKGYRVVFTPYVELYHYESLTRGREKSKRYREERKKEALFIREKWKNFVQNDPFYNPNLELKGEAFSLSLEPRVTKPWKEKTYG